ncbi:NADH-FMN oxidoreductase RutF, flavin reductase (DIM6/NTAB) family [Gordonia malaquae]|uniref:Putative oxidoreductase n=1 Tax=Gordonia malaquae NBRC 108250 TaxID=1223542 RepID=M3VH02_GORML|nr:flavin reductase family protein [Gordonia malaquae]GAC81444.1 putative oxidoreductase [Gordonia malaquae NBRC 108250]SEB89588.1 NADH-FMN oxidoreductase RutF, flavin reductase (DIM6/NTAB) family [Gordonia malaquae]
MTDLLPASDEAALKRAFSCFPTGVVAVCRRTSDGEDVGMSASSFATVSLDPPLVSVCVRDGSTTWPRLTTAERLGVSVFAGHQGEICRRLAGPPEQRFDSVKRFVTESGALMISGAAAHLDCSVLQEIPAGDHHVVLLRIHALRSDPSVEPLVFHASTFRALEARRTQS